MSGVKKLQSSIRPPSRERLLDRMWFLAYQSTVLVSCNKLYVDELQVQYYLYYFEDFSVN